MDLLVHHGEAAGQAGLAGLSGGQIVQLIQKGLDEVGHRDQLLAAPAPPDGVDLLLGGLQNILGFPQALLNHAGDLPGSLGQGAEKRLVLDDLDVLHDIGAGRGDLHQLNQIIPGGLAVICAVFPHLLRHCNPVDGLGVAEHMVNCLKNIPVLFDIEILGPDLVHDLLDTVGVNEHGAQGGLFGIQAVRHLAGEDLVFKSHRSFSFFSLFHAGNGGKTATSPPLPSRRWFRTPHTPALPSVHSCRRL